MSQLEADMETVFAQMVKTFGDQLQREHDAREREDRAIRADLEAATLRLTQRQDFHERWADERWSASQEDATRHLLLTDPLRRDFWGRLRWFLTGE